MVRFEFGGAKRKINLYLVLLLVLQAVPISTGGLVYSASDRQHSGSLK